MVKALLLLTVFDNFQENPSCIMWHDYIFFDSFAYQVDMEKVNLDVIKPWITKKLIEILGVEDDVVMQYVLNMLESEKVNR